MTPVTTQSSPQLLFPLNSILAQQQQLTPAQQQQFIKNQILAAQMRNQQQQQQQQQIAQQQIAQQQIAQHQRQFFQKLQLQQQQRQILLQRLQKPNTQPISQPACMNHKPSPTTPNSSTTTPTNNISVISTYNNPLKTPPTPSVNANNNNVINGRKPCALSTCQNLAY
ncbi:11701_t:CDS:1, partial [Ambispora leptoticha]